LAKWRVALCSDFGFLFNGVPQSRSLPLYHKGIYSIIQPQNIHCRRRRRRGAAARIARSACRNRSARICIRRRGGLNVCALRFLPSRRRLRLSGGVCGTFYRFLRAGYRDLGRIGHKGVLILPRIRGCFHQRDRYFDQHAPPSMSHLSDAHPSQPSHRRRTSSPCASARAHAPVPPLDEVVNAQARQAAFLGILRLVARTRRSPPSDEGLKLSCVSDVSIPIIRVSCTSPPGSRQGRRQRRVHGFHQPRPRQACESGSLTTSNGFATL